MTADITPKRAVRMTQGIHIDRFSAGLDDLTRKQQADHVAVLRVLQRTGRYSVFEATDNQTIAKTMDRLISANNKGGALVKTLGGDYPWTAVELTDAGRALLADTAKRAGERSA